MYEAPKLERYGTFRELTMTDATSAVNGGAVLHHEGGDDEWGWSWGWHWHEWDKWWDFKRPTCTS